MKACAVPSLTLSLKADKLSLRTKSWYGKKPAPLLNEEVTLIRFGILLHSGLCQRMPTTWAAQWYDTSMQVRRSPVVVSLANIESSSSGGSLEIGDSRCSRSMSTLTLISRRLVTPSEDCESFTCIMKKSVSSSARGSGELIDESESERASLACRLCERRMGASSSILLSAYRVMREGGNSMYLGA